MNDDRVHVCDVRVGGGSRFRFLAFRFNCREALADFDIKLIVQERGKPPLYGGGVTIMDYPRALGVDRLFSELLLEYSRNEKNPKDEFGNTVPMPIETVEEKRRLIKWLWDESKRYEMRALQLANELAPAGGAT